MKQALYIYLNASYIYVYTRHSIDNHWFCTKHVMFSTCKEDVKIYAFLIFVCIHLFMCVYRCFIFYVHIICVMYITLYVSYFVHI